MMTKSLYYLHICIDNGEFLHQVTFEPKYINIVNSSNFFLPEHEEVKSFIFRAENANAGMGL